MVFFSDAVFAIVLTLLALELRPPAVANGDEAALIEGLKSEVLPTFLAFVLSFAIIAQFWTGHVRMTRRLSTPDGLVQGNNLVFLFSIALIPFASALFGRNPDSKIALFLYCLVMTTASFSQTALWIAIARGRGRLIGGVTWRENVYQLLRAGTVGLLFSVLAAMLWLNVPSSTGLFWVIGLLPVLMLVRRLVAPKDPQSKKHENSAPARRRA